LASGVRRTMLLKTEDDLTAPRNEENYHAAPISAKQTVLTRPRLSAQLFAVPSCIAPPTSFAFTSGLLRFMLFDVFASCARDAAAAILFHGRFRAPLHRLM
jgi:hypothetical protein